MENGPLSATSLKAFVNYPRSESFRKLRLYEVIGGATGERYKAHEERAFQGEGLYENFNLLRTLVLIQAIFTDSGTDKLLLTSWPSVS